MPTVAAFRTRPPLHRTSGRRHSTVGERRLIWGILGLAAAVGLFAPGEPAGWTVADAVLRAGGAIGLTLITSYARRWTWLVLAGGAGVFAGGEALPTTLAAAALALALVGNNVPRRSRPMGAGVGALAAHAMMRWPTDGFSGRPTVLTVLVCLPLIVSFWRVAPRRVRRQITFGAAGVATFVTLATAAFVASAWASRSTVLRAIDLAEEGLDLARDGDQDGAARKFTLAAEQFSKAQDRIAAPWARPARLIPFVGPQARALDTATREGARLSEVAAVAASEVELDALTLRDGHIDLALIEGFAPPLRRTADALNRAATEVDAADSPWLLWNVDSRIERFQEELADAQPTANDIADGLEAAPALLGGDGSRSYLVVFMTPAELRGLGGFIGAFAQLDVDDGQLTLTRTGRPDELNRVLRSGAPSISGPEDYLERYSRYRPELFFQDVSFSPDFPSVAQVVAELYPQAGGVRLDGVIALDPRALAGLIRLTGPVEVGGVRLGPDNTEEFLLHEQYVDFVDGDDQRQDLLDDALREVFDRLLSIEAPTPRALADALRPAVRQDRLMFHSTHAGEQALFEQIGVSGTFPAPDGHDFLAVTSQNAANNKIDYFLQRQLFYDVTYDPARGSVSATLAVTLTNDAPAAGLPASIIGSNDRGLAPGTNQMLLSVYTPHALSAASIDGAATSTQRGTERGRQVYTLFVSVAPGESKSVRFELEGFIRPDDGYLLRVAPHPTVKPDQLQITVVDTDSEPLGSIQTAGDLVDDASPTGPVRLELERDLTIGIGDRGE